MPCLARARARVRGSAGRTCAPNVLVSRVHALLYVPGLLQAAPFSTSRLADAGARVIKIERNDATGDFARGYDEFAGGLSSYFVWLNRGKESVQLDLKDTADLALMEDIIASADVFVQNFAPGATERLGLGSGALRAKYPQLITVDISG